MLSRFETSLGENGGSESCKFGRLPSRLRNESFRKVAIFVSFGKSASGNDHDHWFEPTITSFSLSLSSRSFELSVTSVTVFGSRNCHDGRGTGW